MSILDDLKVGDDVVSESRSGYRIGKVSKLTKTQIVVQFGKSEFRFNRRTHRLVGGDEWHPTILEHLTPKIIQEITLLRKQSEVREILEILTKYRTKLTLEECIKIIECQKTIESIHDVDTK